MPSTSRVERRDRRRKADERCARGRQPPLRPQVRPVRLSGWLHVFQPDPQLRERIIAAIASQAAEPAAEDSGEQRRQNIARLERLRDLYLMGDLSKAQYVMRRQTIEEELQRTEPPTDPHLDRARRVLEDFARFWDAEPEPAERRKLLAELFRAIWQKDGQIVAVRPHPSLAPYFAAVGAAQEDHADPKAGSDSGEVTSVGPTPVAPAL